MNERIRELADQAELTVRTGRGNTYMSHPEFNKKFAELIVQDIASLIESQHVDPAFKHRMSWAVKDRYGAEEDFY